jgi:hypothetical protein
MLALTPQISQFALENLSKNIEVRLLGFAFSNTKRGKSALTHWANATMDRNEVCHFNLGTMMPLVGQGGITLWFCMFFNQKWRYTFHNSPEKIIFPAGFLTSYAWWTKNKRSMLPPWLVGRVHPISLTA